MVFYYNLLYKLSFIALLVGIENDIDSSHEKLGWQLIPYLIFYCSR